MLAFYAALREKSGLTHEEAIRDSIVSVLMSPKFCYRIDLVGTAGANSGQGRPLSNYALASRLSYFLWSSMPDEKLLARAATGDLQKPEVLVAQARRMLKDDRARGLATEFAGNWLDFRRFEEHNAVDRERFPSFNNELREAMFEEPIRFMEDVIRNDRSVLDLLYGNYTFVNPVLARHYGMPEVTGKADRWVRWTTPSSYGRGGLLPMAVFLTQNAPGLRTSPVKRGYWVVRRVLGETIPPPPRHRAGIARTMRRSWICRCARCWPSIGRIRACASCHARFDSFGLAFEGYGPIGEKRCEGSGGPPCRYTGGLSRRQPGTGIRGRASLHPRASREGFHRQSLPKTAGLRSRPVADALR